jgi:hypothetical protein
MNYLHPSYNRRTPLATRIAWGAVVVALFFLFILITQRTGLREKLFSFGGVLWNKNPQGQVVYSNDALLLAVKLLSQENRELHTLLGRDGSRAARVVGRVLVRPHDKAPYDTLIIDVGSRQGIKKGNKVIIDQKTIIGEVAEVFLNESKVLLFSSAGIKTPVLVGEKNIIADAVGRGGGNYEINLPREADTPTDALVVYASAPAYVLGAINVIQETESDHFKKILFIVPTALGQIRYVDVLISQT